MHPSNFIEVKKQRVLVVTLKKLTNKEVTIYYQNSLMRNKKK